MPNKNAVKLKRYKRKDGSGVYEIDAYNLCKLVDALSGGELPKYLELYVGKAMYHVDATLSIERMSRYLSTRLRPEHAKQIFGSIHLVSSRDYEHHFNMSQGFDAINVSNSIRAYLKDYYMVVDSKFQRRQGLPFFQ